MKGYSDIIGDNTETNKTQPVSEITTCSVVDYSKCSMWPQLFNHFTTNVSDKQMENKLNSHTLDTELGHYMRNHMFQEMVMNIYPDYAASMPVSYKEIENEVLNLEIRPDDVWLITFPKCGTTWSQEMIWMIANDLDYEGAKVNNFERFPFLEFAGVSENIMELFGIPKDDPLASVKGMKSPRLIKTHLPVGLLPRQLREVKPKIIYVMREPKDAAVSFFNHYRILNGYTGSKDKFFESFISDQVYTGSYWGNIAPFWKTRHQPNVLINTFEEMKKDLPAIIRRTAKFLDKIVPEVEMEKLVEYLHFSSMKDNEYTNMKTLVDTVRNIHGVAKDQEFMNKGVVGNYKDKMSAEWIKRFDDWTCQEKIRYGLTDKDFPY